MKIIIDKSNKELKNIFTQKITFQPIIPLNIFQTWETKNLPFYMNNCVESIKRNNPEFEHYLFDDEDCELFIKEFFPKIVLKAYNKLIPGAYKADLWRLCVLYIYGGIYLDIKFHCIKPFKLIYLTDKEYYVNDWNKNTKKFDIKMSDRIYNGFMICQQKNPLLLKMIHKIVENVNNNFYGRGCLHPTGPKLLNSFFNKNEKINFQLNLFAPKENKTFIRYGLLKILGMYKKYRTEQKLNSSKKHYSILWNNRKIYKN